MGLRLMDLERVRVLMCAEIGNDVDHGALYLSKRLTPHGVARYPELLHEAARTGDDVDLENALRRPGMLKRREQVWRGGHLITRAVPRTAATILAEGEFNRYYIRGVCRSALALAASVEVYRAKLVEKPRWESERLIGEVLDPAELLADLRFHPGRDPYHGVPGGPGSGLSVRIVEIG